jgi:hypothetical protein
MRELFLGKVHFLQGLQVHYVQAGPPSIKHFEKS